MTATARAVTATLLRAGLAAAVLAIIAGIFGMHVMTGNHSAHGTHAAAVQVQHDHTEAAHPEHQDQPVAAAAASGAMSCGRSCQGMQESGTSCIPSAQAGALALFPPHQTGVAFHAPEVRSGPAASYTYTRPSPTPCELSISRT